MCRKRRKAIFTHLLLLVNLFYFHVGVGHDAADDGLKKAGKSLCLGLVWGVLVPLRCTEDRLGASDVQPIKKRCEWYERQAWGPTRGTSKREMWWGGGNHFPQQSVLRPCGFTKVDTGGVALAGWSLWMPCRSQGKFSISFFLWRILLLQGGAITARQWPDSGPPQIQ